MAKNDEQIKKDIVDQLYWDTRVDASSIKVKVDDGSVTLEGKIPSVTAKLNAEDDAWIVSGVSEINNKLKVKYPAAVQVPTDLEIKNSVEATYSANNLVDEEKINVTVADGWVTLEGSQTSLWRKIRAQDLASGMRGVIGVKNKLTVVPTEDIVDETIAEDIVDAIDRNINVAVDDVDVKVEDGKAVLSGTVDTWAARRAAYDSALYTAGVTEIEDNIVVSTV